MIESAAYEMIKKEGYDEGIQQGILQTIESLLLGRFGTEGLDVLEKASEIRSVDRLKTLVAVIPSAENHQEVPDFLKKTEAYG